MKVTFMVCGD